MFFFGATPPGLDLLLQSYLCNIYLVVVHVNNKITTLHELARNKRKSNDVHVRQVYVFRVLKTKNSRKFQQQLIAYYYKKCKYTPAFVTSKISSKLIFASCV